MHLYAIGVGREVAMRHRWAGGRGRSRSMNFCDHRRRRLTKTRTVVVVWPSYSTEIHLDEEEEVRRSSCFFFVRCFVRDAEVTWITWTMDVTLTQLGTVSVEMKF